MSFSIRPCTAVDAVALSTVAAATFLETYAGIVDGRDILFHCGTTHAPASYARLLADTSKRLFLAEIDEGRAPIGFMLMGPPDLPVETGEGDIELTRIYALHRFHGGGLGQALMDTAVAAAREAGAKRLLLAVYSRNGRALAFYGRNGFKQVGTRVFHVGDNGYDDYVLAKAL
ncbi:MAG TPA: GNAT family N-acetyltransferase [Caulobacter sp.]|nr:GNAT family N-acetyltransferase [Caulobacter sp.]